MTDTENIDIQKTDPQSLEQIMANDKTGFAEMEKAIEELNKLEEQNNLNEQEGNVKEEVEAVKVEPINEIPTEEVQEDETAENEIEDVGPSKKETKLWKEKRGKFSALAALKREQERSAELEKMLHESLNSGTYHFNKSAHADLEKAKDNMRRAMEEGDTNAYIEANMAVAEAIHVINDLKKWSYQNETQYKAPAPQVNNIPKVDNTNNYESATNNYNPVDQEIIMDWLDDHPYLQPTSKHYDSKLANHVSSFVNNLDADMAKKGQQDLYYSERYFDTIEKYIADIKKDIPKVVKKVEPDAHIGSVRNSYSGPSNNRANSPTQMILTADEKMMAANAGVSEKEWLKYKVEEFKNNR